MRNIVLRGVFSPINPVGMIIMSAYMIMWGIWLIGPWDAFDLDDEQYYFILVLPEWLLGTFAALIGLVIGVGAFNKSKKFFVNSCFLSFMFWFAIAVTLFLGNWRNPVWIAMLLPAAYSMFFYLNLSILKEANLTHNKS